jgi:catechol 2,3-dioxygenase-like lactoylglutathione lyase family enzyme
VYLGWALVSAQRGLEPSAAPGTEAYNLTMTAKSKLLRMDNVLIVVEDLDAAKAFFAELGMELEGETTVEGDWADRVVGLKGVRADIAMMRTPDGHNRVELSRFHTPPAVCAEPAIAPSNTLGIRRLMFAVEDVNDVVARLRKHGAELVGEIADYKDIYRLCFLRGPEGIIIGLAEELGKRKKKDG